MYPSSIYYRRLIDKATIRINYEDCIHLHNTLEAKMYPKFESPNHNILRFAHALTIWKKLPEWQYSPKMWEVPKNQTTTNQMGMDIKVSVVIAIVLFEICEASNHPDLVRLKDHIHAHLKEEFNIILPITTLIIK